MKSLKSILSLLLAALLLCSAALPVFADSELVTKAEMWYTIPTIGDKASSLRPESGDPDKYLISVDEIYYFDKDENGNNIVVKLSGDDTFKEGVTYRIRFEFVPQSGYRLDDNQTTFIIDGRENQTIVGRYTRETSFQAKPAGEQDAQEAGECPYCHKDHNGFFGFIVKFFHKILFRLFGEKK